MLCNATDCGRVHLLLSSDGVAEAQVALKCLHLGRRIVLFRDPTHIARVVCGDFRVRLFPKAPEAHDCVPDLWRHVGVLVVHTLASTIVVAWLGWHCARNDCQLGPPANHQHPSTRHGCRLTRLHVSRSPIGQPGVPE